MSRKALAILLALSLAVLPVASCSTLQSLWGKVCDRSEFIQDNLEVMQQKLEIVRSFLAVSTPDDLQVELEIRDIPFVVTKEDIDNTLALVDTVLATLKTAIADACAGNVDQVLKAAASLEGNATVYAALLRAKKANSPAVTDTMLKSGWKK